MKRYHIIVHGRVQGVGFRFFTEREAEKQQVNGWVRNRQNGTVEITIEGPDHSCRSFIEAIKQGPPGAIVKQTDIEEVDQLQGEENFQITH